MYRQYHFKPPCGGLARTADEATKIASEVGFPVAVKIASLDILHKTDIGGVVLNLDSADTVRRAFDHVIASARTVQSQARIDGVEVQEMVTGGTEIIIGLLDDSQFGPIIMFGLGGVFAEVLKDVSFRVLPIEAPDALQMIHEIKSYQVLQGYRGRPIVSEKMLVDLLLNASHMGIDFAGKLESVDLNPIMVWEDQHRVLDAKILWHSEAHSAAVGSVNIQHIETFFKARSVALVGASATPGKIGYAVLDSLLKHEYGGRVYPVNPERNEIMGARTYPSLAAIPHPVELAVLTADLRYAPEVIAQCADRGIHNLVIVSGGGKELGGDRAKLETEIRGDAKSHDVRVIGPNCIGVFDGQTRLDTFFQVHERMVRPKSGRIAMITQSGTVGAAFLEHAADIGISKFVSYGNRTDVDEADLLAYLAGDPETAVIGMYVEGFEDGRKFLQTAKQISKNKPVVVFKAGRTGRGARASLSHTGFFGGSYGVVEGALKQAGLITVNSYEELIAACKALAMQPQALGPRVAMISNGAGTMVQAIDLLESYSLELPELCPESLNKLAKVYPPFYLIQNPIDVTGSANSKDYAVGIEVLMLDPSVDIVMPWFVFQDTPLDEAIVQELGRLTTTHNKPILVGALGGPYTTRMARAIEAEGVPVYHSVRDWVAAARGLVQNGNRL